MSVLETPTLILNKGWYAIDATTAQDAFCMMFAERAKGLCAPEYCPYSIEQWLDLEVREDAPFVIGANEQKIMIPEIIIASEFNKIPERVVVFSRRNLWRRDGGFCQYCGKKPLQDEVTIDHVVPQQRGGKSTFENCVLACLTCNQKKNNRTPEEAGMPLVRWAKEGGEYVLKSYHRPKRPNWSPIYAARRKILPASWRNFIRGKLDELYWLTELDPNPNG